MNFVSTTELAGSGERFATAAEFFEKMGGAWSSVRSQVLKMETRQKYVEAESPSWVAWMVENNWAKSMELLEGSREEDVPLYDELKKRGVDFVRCRPVNYPLSPYMKWEFEVFKFNQRHGERIFIANSVAVPSFTADVAQHDFMVFDATVACIHNYDEEGLIVGGWWLKDQRAILELMKIHTYLKSNSLPFEVVRQANEARTDG
ncbi:DUF6879 family protein [uncultured Litoreibacter sp.]|uniref:DUF6879 family protein n=1 Tax=uncultured Litoreibacter sp. TaxID=1392394 RepID=UPI0026185A5F|nr:DUF6879 family protein [uncultured Litoreibacter sp.]